MLSHYKNLVSFFILICGFLSVRPLMAASFDIEAAIFIQEQLIAHKEMKRFGYSKISDDRLFQMVESEAKKLFSSVSRFSPSENPNYFLLVQLTYGAYNPYNKKLDHELHCISLQYEHYFGGVTECDEDIDDAIEEAFDSFYDEEKKALKKIVSNKRRIIWTEAIDKGKVEIENKKLVGISSNSVEVSHFKERVRLIFSKYFKTPDGKALRFFKSKDLIFVLLNSKEHINNNSNLLNSLIKGVRKRDRMLPFYLNQAIRINAPTEIINNLLSKKGSPDEFRDADGNTPVMQAAFSGDIELLRFFLDKGSDKNKKNRNGFNLLHMAAVSASKNKSFEVIDFLIEQGLDINGVSKDGATPLLMGLHFNKVFNGNEFGRDLVKGFLSRGAEVNPNKEYIDQTISPLMQAVLSNDEQAAGLLLDAGADPNIFAKFSYSPLFKAVESGNESMTIQLLEYGADPNLKGGNGRTALFAAYPEPSKALSSNNKAMIQKLVDYGANVLTIDNSGRSANEKYWSARTEFLEEQRRLAEQRRLREIAKQRRAAEQERLRKIREARERENKKNQFQWGKMLAMGAGFIAGRGYELPQEAQTEILFNMMKDSQGGVEGANSTMSAINKYTKSTPYSFGDSGSGYTSNTVDDNWFSAIDKQIQQAKREMAEMDAYTQKLIDNAQKAQAERERLAKAEREKLAKTNSPVVKEQSTMKNTQAYRNPNAITQAELNRRYGINQPHVSSAKKTVKKMSSNSSNESEYRPSTRTTFSWEENALAACGLSCESITIKQNRRHTAKNAVEACQAACDTIHWSYSTVSGLLRCELSSPFQDKIAEKLSKKGLSDYQTYANTAWGIWQDNKGCLQK